jgi:succinoglycan biosynthesis protein ExoA
VNNEENERSSFAKLLSERGTFLDLMNIHTLTNEDYLVTVILPIRNEEAHIANCLKAVVDQNYPKEKLEILVVDGRSTDRTRDIVMDIQTAHKNIHLIDNPGEIVPTGLNMGIRQARGEIIIRVDGHTIIEPDYVNECVKTLTRTGAENAGGKMEGFSETPFGKAVVLATSSPFGIGNARFHFSNQEEYVDTVYLGAWPKDVFDKIGYFDEEMVRDQDDELNYRLRQRGGKIILNPRIKSTYTVRATTKGLWKQYFQYGFWKVRVLQKHPRQMSIRQFVPPLFISMLAFLSLFSIFSRLVRSIFAIIAGTYVMANVLATLLTAKNNPRNVVIRLPITFAILHFAYGTGFLSGLFKFLDRWDIHGKDH